MVAIENALAVELKSGAIALAAIHLIAGFEHMDRYEAGPIHG